MLHAVRRTAARPSVLLRPAPALPPARSPPLVPAPGWSIRSAPRSGSRRTLIFGS